MKHIVLFIFLIINIVNASQTQEALTVYVWNPYHTNARQTLSSPEFILPETSEVTLDPASPLVSLDTKTNLSVLSMLSQDLTDFSTSTSAQPSETDIKLILNRLTSRFKVQKIDSLETQQAYFNQLLESYKILASAKKIITKDQFYRTFLALQCFLNREYYRLGSKLTCTIEQEYDQLIMFCNELTAFDLFSKHQIIKLRCYSVTFLIGLANISGIRHRVENRIKYLEQGLLVTQSIGQDVKSPYLTEKNFQIDSMLSFFQDKLLRSKVYLSHMKKNKRNSELTVPRIASRHRQ